MTRKILLTILIFTELSMFSQKNIGVKISGGISKITKEYGSFEHDHVDHFSFSGQMGIFGDISLGKRSNLTTELSLTQIEGKETSESNLYVDPLFVTGQVSVQYYSHITYLALPLYYGFKINKLTINGGFQGAIKLLSSGLEKGNGIMDGESYNWTKEEDLYIDRFDFGLRMGFVYDLNSHISIEGIYYKGMNNLNRENDFDFTSKIQQVTLGLRYRIKTIE